MSSKLQIPFIGTELFCPDCRRLLVRVHDNGQLEVAGMAEAIGSAEGKIDDEGNVYPPDAFVVTDATCKLRRCRTKRWIRTNIRRK